MVNFNKSINFLTMEEVSVINFFFKSPLEDSSSRVKRTTSVFFFKVFKFKFNFFN